MPAIIYNAEHIKEWKIEKENLCTRIEEHTQSIFNLNSIITPLQSEFQLLQSRINSVQFQITDIEIRYPEYRYDYRNENRHGHHYNNGVLGVGNLLASVNLGILRMQLNTLQRQSRELESQIQPHLNQIMSTNLNIRKARNKVEWLDQQINNGGVFLHLLRTNPSELVTQLKNKISASFKLYDDKHPTERSVEARISLYHIHEKLNYLSVAPECSSLRNGQINYLQLCALLQDMYERVESEGQDTEFTKVLKTLLELTYIPTNGDLPDEMVTGQAAAVYQEDVVRQNPHLFSICPARLSALEEEDYILELGHFNSQTIDIKNELQKSIVSAVKAVDTEVERKKQKNELIDYHFYTRVLRDLFVLASDPKDLATIQHLGLLADVAAGAPSLGKRVAGALVAVLGLLIVAASIACLAATFGGSSFASGLGVALGLSLIQSQITLSITASTLAIFPRSVRPEERA